MRAPTDKEIEEGKEYLHQRLDAELSMRTNLQIVMIEAAKQIIDISYRYKISPELFRFSANRQLQKEVDAIKWEDVGLKVRRIYEEVIKQYNR